MDEYCWPHSVPPRNVIKKFRNSWESVFWFALSSDYNWYPKEVREMTDGAVVGEHDSSHSAWSKIQGSGKRLVPESGRGLSYPSNVLKIRGRDVATGHPGAFPTGLPYFFMRCCSLEGELWFDPFCGSGTSIFAAEKSSRVCYGMEKMPKYVSLILELAEGQKLKMEKIK